MKEEENKQTKKSLGTARAATASSYLSGYYPLSCPYQPSPFLGTSLFLQPGTASQKPLIADSTPSKLAHCILLNAWLANAGFPTASPCPSPQAQLAVWNFQTPLGPCVPAENGHRYTFTKDIVQSYPCIQASNVSSVKLKCAQTQTVPWFTHALQSTPHLLDLESVCEGKQIQDPYGEHGSVAELILYMQKVSSSIPRIRKQVMHETSRSHCQSQ